MSHAQVEWLDPTGRMDRRFGHRPKQVKPLEVIKVLLDQRELDCDLKAVDEDDLVLAVPSPACSGIALRAGVVRAAAGC